MKDVKIVSKKELWILQAPAFNFELNEDQLLNEALVEGYVKKVGQDQYEINNDY